jgi:MFS family permease
MTTADLPLADGDMRAKRNVRVLVAAQAILGAQMPVHFILGGLSGQVLAINKCFSTLPISVIIFASMFTAPLMAAFMQRRGRRPGFVIGTLAGALGAALCAAGLWANSFALFIAARCQAASSCAPTASTASPRPTARARPTVRGRSRW